MRRLDISYCVEGAAGCVHREGKVSSTRRELDSWIGTLPQPRMSAMEATIFTGWIYDHLLPHADKVKVAHPLMLRAIATAKRKNDKIDAIWSGSVLWPVQPRILPCERNVVVVAAEPDVCAAAVINLD